MEKTQVAVYYFPNYHIDEKNEERHGQGWNEWELLKNATPRFQGHQQPKIPLWGYEDESKPEVMEKKINAAFENKVDAFIFDWYWYDGASYLHNCLEKGFLKAKNTNKLKFSLMWANHDWNDLFPAPRHGKLHNFANGMVNESEFDKMTDYIIEKYFSQPNYWKVEGGLYFSIYDLPALIKGLGGLDKTKLALQSFRAKVRAAGYGELHLNAIITARLVLPCEENLENQSEIISFLGFESVTSYVWIHHYELPDFPLSDYSKARIAMKTISEDLIKKYDIPCFPNVTMGWDSSPRTVQSNRFDYLGYPYIPIFKNNTPQEFELALRDAKEINEKLMLTPSIITINAWNEWTEGSYLEPDMENGMAYLEAIKKVFT